MLAIEKVNEIRAQARRLHGYARRQYKARIVTEHGLSTSQARRMFKWGDESTRTALEELRRGVEITAYRHSLWEENHPLIVEQIAKIIDEAGGDVSVDGIYRRMKNDPTFPRECVPRAVNTLHRVLNRLGWRARIVWEQVHAEELEATPC